MLIFPSQRFNRSTALRRGKPGLYIAAISQYTQLPTEEFDQKPHVPQLITIFMNMQSRVHDRNRYYNRALLFLDNNRLS